MDLSLIHILSNLFLLLAFPTALQALSFPILHATFLYEATSPYPILNNKEIKDYSNFKVIIADTEYETFDEILKIKENFSFINLSSEFAVNFIIEYEKINLMVLSQNITNYRELIKKAERKKIKTIVLGENIPYPLNCLLYTSSIKVY